MSADTEMTLTEVPVQNAMVVEVSGRINSANAKQFGNHLINLIENGCDRLVVDLKGLEYMTSAGFRSLLVAGKSASRHQCDYALCSLSDEVKRLFELGGFLDLFPIYGDSNTAVDKTQQ